jgi:hypothetical protein
MKSNVPQNFKKAYSASQESIKRMEVAMCGMPGCVPGVRQMHEFAFQELKVSRNCEILN